MTRRELAALLVSLGDTPDAVAAKLSSLGCRGVRHAASECPLAAYLLANDVEAPEVHCGYVVWTEGRVADHISMPAAVGAFRQKFDCGAYRDLIAGEHPAKAVAT